jgi:hypothetical protein
MACHVFVFRNLPYNKKKRKKVQCPHLCFFHNTNYIKRKKEGTMPPLVYLFCNIRCSKKGGTMAPMCFFSQHWLHQRGRGRKPCPPLGLFHSIGYNMKKRGGTMSPLRLFHNNNNNRMKRGCSQRKRVEKLSPYYKS